VTLPDGRDLLVDLLFRDGRWLARVDGQEHALDLRRGANGETVVDVDGESFRVRGHNGSTRLVGATGEHAVAALRVRDAGSERLEWRTRPRSEEADGAALALRSPLTGLVIDVRVAPGDRVSAGQTLLVIEAMKMENRVAAPAAGVIAEVAVSVGDTVRVGAPMLRFAALGEAHPGGGDGA
jgi:biotin carboxyl carrier protein